MIVYSLIVFHVFLLLVKTSCGQRNNVCNTTAGYYLRFLPGCYYDPDVDSTVPEIIKRYGYEVDVHEVISEDGYISTLFRIPNAQAQPVLLLHSDLATSASYVLSKNDSLAFVLAARGYDVWLGNIRGSQYSQGHVNKTTEDNSYWNYSIDEIAMYDMPVMLDLIEKKAGKKGVIFVGFAIAAPIVMAYSATNPGEASERIKLAVLMSSTVQFKHTKVFVSKIVGQFGAPLWETVYGLGLAKFLSAYKYQKFIEKVLTLILGVPLLFNVVVNTFGPNTQIPINQAPALLSSELCGLSLKALVHMFQFSTNNFSRFDYGSLGNRKIYGNQKSPSYNISNVRHPVFLVYAVDDYLATPRDNELQFMALSQEAKKFGKYEVSQSGFNHFGYAYAPSARTLVYDRLIELFSQIP